MPSRIMKMSDSSNLINEISRVEPHPLKGKKFAVISDIHGNIEALNAVLADIKSKGITEIHCLGDVVGYGPDPIACLQVVNKECDIKILGNHDKAAFSVYNDFSKMNPTAARALMWTRKRLEKSAQEAGYISSFKTRDTKHEIDFVHGSPRDTTYEYLLPGDVNSPTKIKENMKAIQGKWAFCGHTHKPGVFSQSVMFYSAAAPFSLDPQSKAIVNVGSVGQPRDYDPKACYVTVEDGLVTWHRVPYDVKETVAKMRQIEELDPFLSDRLLIGR